MKVKRLFSRRATTLRIAGLCGIIPPLLGLIILAIAIYYCPSFSWTGSYLSLLGVEGAASTLFNASLIAGGVLNTAFAIGLGKGLLSGQLLGRLGALTLILGACAMCAIGILPRTTGAAHDYASVAFFSLVPLSLFLIGAALVTSSEKGLGFFTFISGILMVALQLVPWRWSGDAIPQMLSSIPWSLWLVALGIKLLNLSRAKPAYDN